MLELGGQYGGEVKNARPHHIRRRGKALGRFSPYGFCDGTPEGVPSYAALGCIEEWRSVLNWVAIASFRLTLAMMGGRVET